MFFDDAELALKKHSRLRVPPAVPETGWRPPTSFPNFDGVSVISFDVETRETDFDNGPGWARGKGHIVGFSVAARKGKSAETGKWYFPIRHEVNGEDNLDPQQCLAWLKYWLEQESIPKVGANLLYDMGWLTTENIFVRGRLHDVQFAQALLDETSDTNLDFLARKYLKRNKTSDELYEWLALAYGGDAGPAQRENIWRAPPRLVGPYGEDDADLPLRIFEEQHPLLASEGLLNVFALENRLIPLLIKMRLRGVRVDVARAAELHHKLGGELIEREGALAAGCGFAVNVNSGGSVAKLFDHVGISYLKNPDTGKPIFQKEFLKGIDHPVAKEVLAIRETKKLRSTFLESYILKSHRNGIIHCQFHPLRDASDGGDSSGTKTGRFASSTPNLQNIPVRSKLGKLIREIFVAHHGHMRWRKFDYSQIEYRMLAHFATNEKNGASADQLRAEYNANPNTDYHNRVMLKFAAKAGINLDAMTPEEKDTFRKPIKNVNFGLLYGQTEKALALKSGLTQLQAREFFADYHQSAPYVKSTMEAIEGEVYGKGFVQTIIDRRTRFNLWESSGRERTQALPYHAALREYGGAIRRAYAYRGVNYKLQGSAADVIKIAMDNAHTQGIFDVIGYPLLQVHDELDFSEIDDSPAQTEAYAYLTHVLENSVKLNVPVKVDSSHGTTWAQAK